MSKRVHKNESSKKKKKSKTTKWKIKIISTNKYFFYRDAPENNSNLSIISIKSIPLKTTDIENKLIFSVYNNSN